MNELSSLDYSNLISWIAYAKQGVLLNKTQMQKILFICYGIYLAAENKKLFTDDTPKAWPFGPVFPRVNKKFVPGRTPSPFSKEIQLEFSKNKKAIDITRAVIDKYSKVSAGKLSEWSHEEGGPWYNTIYGEGGDNKDVQWNKEISDDLIKSYFLKTFSIGKIG